MTRLRPVDGTPRIRLICFSYAGGGLGPFRDWAPEVPDGVELLGVRLPGHGSRIRERPHTDWEPLVDEVTGVLGPYLAEPHALFGHSFGGRLAYEVARRAEARHPGRTRRLFVAACRAPDTPQARPYLHELTDARLRDAMGAMGGVPREVLRDDRMMGVLLPVVRAEMRLAELWGVRPGTGLAAPVTALYGRDDPVDGAAATRRWPRFSRAAGEVLEVPGGHFFLDTHRPWLLDVIGARLGGD
ncbi:thioesterase II family protein [Streptomyces roseolilacinus]|uniref:thioesterase II family protein n=1 Tax=Streptomyces roseolilacinus TaxID=66904 RepID=UPI003814F77F